MSVAAAASPPLRRPGLAISITVLVAIVGALLAGDDPGGAWQWLHWICKPLATALIFLPAWNRFDGPIPLAALWVLATYYLSLWWIARSVAREGGIVEAGASQ